MGSIVTVPNSFSFSPREPSDFPDWTFQNVDLEYDAGSRSAWMYYKADGPPFFSLQTLVDMASVRESLRGAS